MSEEQGSDYEEPVEGEENAFYAQHRHRRQAPRRKKVAPPPPAERDHLIPFQQPIQDANIMSVNYQVTDAVAYYGNMALWSLFYGRGTRGVVAPVLYDTARGGLYVVVE
jgi:hypothetical protein